MRGSAGAHLDKEAVDGVCVHVQVRERAEDNEGDQQARPRDAEACQGPCSALAPGHSALGAAVRSTLDALCAPSRQVALLCPEPQTVAAAPLFTMLVFSNCLRA